MPLFEKVCAAAGVLCLLYYVGILLYAGITADFAWIWPVAAVFLLFLGGVFHFRNSLPGPVLPTLLILTGTGLLLFGCISFQIVNAMFQRTPSDLDCVIVLGAQVKGTVPSRALKKRLDAAALYAEKHPETRLILSGGQGSGEEITEARAMYEYLKKAGIYPERMQMEEKSTTTRENLKFCLSMTNREDRVGILSNNFHIYRAVALAKACGYQQVYGMPAPSDPFMQLHYIVREAFALVKEKTLKNI